MLVTSVESRKFPSILWERARIQTSFMGCFFADTEDELAYGETAELSYGEEGFHFEDVACTDQEFR